MIHQRLYRGQRIDIKVNPDILGIISTQVKYLLLLMQDKDHYK